MSICSRCGCEYEKEDVVLLHADVNRVPIDMCEECLEKAYEMQEDGLFYDTCEECGKDFDVMEEKAKYLSQIPWCDGLGFEYFDKILCADCALNERDNI